MLPRPPRSSSIRTHDLWESSTKFDGIRRRNQLDASPDASNDEALFSQISGSSLSDASTFPIFPLNPGIFKSIFPRSFCARERGFARKRDFILDPAALKEYGQDLIDSFSEARSHAKY